MRYFTLLQIVMQDVRRSSCPSDLYRAAVNVHIGRDMTSNIASPPIEVLLNKSDKQEVIIQGCCVQQPSRTKNSRKLRRLVDYLIRR